MTATGLDLSAAGGLDWAKGPHRFDPESIVELNLGARGWISFPWGRSDGFGTASYWVTQAKLGAYPVAGVTGNSLVEEICFCILGGYGVTAEMDLAAFRALLAAGLIRTDPAPEAGDIEAVLSAPLEVRGRQRLVHYRFPTQRSRRVASALRLLGSRSLPGSPVELRDALLAFDGIGPKTASWVVRNHTGSNDVAIIDVHLRRAGLAAGFFRPNWRLPQDYWSFEAAFLAYACAGEVDAGALDLCIWDQVRRLGRAATQILRPRPTVG